MCKRGILIFFLMYLFCSNIPEPAVGSESTHTSASVVNLSAGEQSGVQSLNGPGHSVISDLPVISNFTADDTSGNVPFTVHFTNLSSGSVQEWEWDFGDGSFKADVPNPAHVYTKAGYYTVSLKVSDPSSHNTNTKTNYIHVRARENVPIPPKWAFEPWVWEDGNNNGAYLLSLIQGYLDRDIPVGVVNIDSPWETAYNTFVFNPDTYPNARDMIDDFHDKKIKVIVWITSLINARSENDPATGKAPTYDYAKNMDYFINNGQTYLWWKGWGSFIDYTNPDALNWWHGQMHQVLNMGIDGWKTDAGSRLFPDTTKCYNGTITKKEYSHLYYQDFFEYTRKVRGDSIILFSKPFDEKPADSTYVPVNYTPTAFVGDQLHDWSNKGLLNALQNVFLTAQRNYVAAGSDIGGFTGDMDMEKNLLIRWAQFGALCPIMENGGHGEHRPWMFDEQTVNIYRYFAKLHSQLVPYLYSYGVRTHNGEAGILRPEPGAWQYRLGEEIFVSVIYQDVSARDITLPAGESWIDYWDDDIRYPAGATLPNYDCPIYKYPIFIKDGAIIPMTVKDDVTGHGSALSAGRLTVIVYPSDSSVFTFYDDDETTDFQCTSTSDIVSLNVSPSTEDYIFRVKYRIRPAQITLNKAVLTGYTSFAEFEKFATGWYYDPEQKYAWIRFSTLNTAANIVITPRTTADFTAFPVSGEAPLTVRFTDQSIAASTREWDFGDGSSLSGEQNPQHTYTDPGYYNVKLTVTGPANIDSLVKPNYIHVGSETFSFTDITASAGCLVTAPGYGQGVVFTDVNMDGKVDLFVANAGNSYLYDFLYINKGANQFQESAVSQGFTEKGHSFTMLSADFDNDGDLDAFLTREPVGSNRTVGMNKIYRNDGGFFSDVTAETGISREYNYSRGAVAADFNNDGWLDLYVVNSAARNAMYLNDGTGEMVRFHSAADGPSGDDSQKWGVTSADIDQDGDIDIYVCRNETPNWLFINDGQGIFTEEATPRGVAFNGRSKGATFVDIDLDGDPDLIVASYSLSGQGLPLLRMFLNRGDGTFHDKSTDYNIAASASAVVMADVDNDADPDMLLIRNNKRDPGAKIQLYLNDGKGGFAYQLTPGLEVAGEDARGAAVADIDYDGDLDLFISCTEGRNFLLRNDLDHNSHYLNVLCIGPEGDYGGYGSGVFVYEPGYYGNNNYLLGYQEATSNTGYMSRNQTELHFGLNGFTNCDVKVILTDGTVLEYRDVQADVTLLVEKPPFESNAPAVFRPLPYGQNNLLLSWTPVSGADGYHVYRDRLATFTADKTGGGNRIAAGITDADPGTDGVQWVDTDPVTGDSEINYFYTVTAVKGSIESNNSNYVGEFDFLLSTTEKSDFNEIALPLDIQDITTAKELMAAVPGCNSVARWNAEFQGYEQYIPGLEFTNFLVQHGHTYYVNITVDGVFTMTGNPVSTIYQLVTTAKTSFNDIMLPLDKTVLTRASELMADIPYCDNVAYWSAEYQNYVQYAPQLPVSDFVIRTGYPYYVSVTDSVLWPSSQNNKIPKTAGRSLMALSTTGAPHVVYGEINFSQRPENLYFSAFIQGCAENPLTQNSPGCIMNDNVWLVQLGRIENGWKAGDKLIVEFFGQDDIKFGSIEKELSWDPADYAGLIRLEHPVMEFMLEQNYPNPFNPATVIRYALPEKCRVELFITDVLGRRVRTLVSGINEAGLHTLEWDGSDENGNRVSSGMYIYSLKVKDKVLRKKLLLMK